MKFSKTKIKLVMAFALIIVSVLSLVSCGGITEEKQTELMSLANEVTECIMNNDINSAVKLMDEEYIPVTELRTVFGQITQYVGEFTEYEVTGPVGFRTAYENGVSYVQNTYLVKTDNKDFYLEIGTITDRSTLCIFRVSLKDDADIANGKLFAGVFGTSFIQIPVLLLGIASLGFTIWMLVDAIKRKIKNKALWIVVILLGCVSFVLTAASGGKINLNFNVGMFFMISSLSLSSGAMALRITLPIGAILYCVRRKELTIQEQTPSPTVPQNPMPTIPVDLSNSYAPAAKSAESAEKEEQATGEEVEQNDRR